MCNTKFHRQIPTAVMVLVLVRNKALGIYAAETNKVFLTGLARLVQI